MPFFGIPSNPTGLLSLNGGPISGFRNQLFNGDFAVAQRGAGPFSASGLTVDGWRFTNGSGATNALSRVARPDNTNRYMISWNRSVTGSTASDLEQRIEWGPRLLGDLPVTISWDYYAPSGAPDLRVFLSCNYGTGGSPSSAATTSAGASSAATTTIQRASTTITVPTNVGKTFGTNDNDYLRVLLDRGTAMADGDIWIGNVQLEIGLTATAFEQLPAMLQLERCKRYFERIGGNIATTPLATGRNDSTTSALFVLPYAEKRGTPTVTVNGTVATDFGVMHKAAATAAPSALALSASTAGRRACQLAATTTGLTAGEASQLRTLATTGTIDISAEL